MTTRLKFDATSGLQATQTGPDEYTIQANAGGGGVTAARLISTTAPLQGGGDLTSDRTLTFDITSVALLGVLTDPVLDRLIVYDDALADNRGISPRSLTADVFGVKHVVNEEQRHLLPAGRSLYVSRYFEIVDGESFEIGLDADLEIG